MEEHEVDAHLAYEFLVEKLEERLEGLEKDDLVMLALWGAGAKCACDSCSAEHQHLMRIASHCEAVSLCRTAISLLEKDIKIPDALILQMSEASAASGLKLTEFVFHAAPETVRH